MLLLVALVMVPRGYGVGQKISQKHDEGGKIVTQNAGSRYLPRPKRWPGVVQRQWLDGPQGEPHLQPAMESWMEHPSLLEMENLRLVKEAGIPYNPSFRGDLYPPGLLINPYDPAEYLVEPAEQPREEILLHPSRQFESPYDRDEFIIHSYEVPQEERVMHPLRRPENRYHPEEFATDHGDQSPENFVMNLWRRPDVRVHDSLDVTTDPKNLDAHRPSTKNILTRTAPGRWNEFVLNSFIKFKYGGDDVFDISEFSWIPGQNSVSPFMIDDMMSWYQPEGAELAIPKLLKDIDFSVVLFEGQSKWEFPDVFKDNSLQMHTVPMSIVRLIRDALNSPRVEVQAVRQQPEEHSWYNLENFPGNPEEGMGLPLENRHAFDFRDYNDYDFVPSKELPNKDPVLLGTAGT